VTYYGSGPDTLETVADLYNRRAGSKFQNLRHAYRTWPALFESYEAVLVMDDDVRIAPRSIDRLFRIREQFDLWVLQPAFHPRGKVSHPITRVRPGAFLRYTNFVEMTCPLFRRDKLELFLRAYDGELVGYGMDWWFLDVLGEDLRGRVAVVDAETCVNPHDLIKDGRREIDRLQPLADRVAAWEETKRRYGIRSEARGQTEFGVVPRPATSRVLAQAASLLDVTPLTARIWHRFRHETRRLLGLAPVR
jgi:hypothetical protein